MSDIFKKNLLISSLCNFYGQRTREFKGTSSRGSLETVKTSSLQFNDIPSRASLEAAKPRSLLYSLRKLESQALRWRMRYAAFASKYRLANLVDLVFFKFIEIVIIDTIKQNS